MTDQQLADGAARAAWHTFRREVVRWLEEEAQRCSLRQALRQALEEGRATLDTLDKLELELARSAEGVRILAGLLQQAEELDAHAATARSAAQAGSMLERWRAAARGRP